MTLIRRNVVACSLAPGHSVDFIVRDGVLTSIIGLCDKRAVDAAERLGSYTCFRLLQRVRQSLRGEVVDPETGIDGRGFNAGPSFWRAFGGATVTTANARRRARQANPPLCAWSRCAQLRELLAQRIERHVGVRVSFTDGLCVVPGQTTTYSYWRDDMTGLHKWKLVRPPDLLPLATELAALSRTAVWMLMPTHGAPKRPWPDPRASIASLAQAHP